MLAGNYSEASSAGGNLSVVRRQLGRSLPEIIYGANDGIITTFAVVSGVVGGKLSPEVVLILGFANLLADGVSMGASDYLSKRSQENAAELVSRRQAARDGTITFLSFVLLGVLPLLAYLTAPDAWRFAVATGVTLVTLFVVGAVRCFFTGRRWWRAGLEMLLVGAAAAAIAYAIGALLAEFVGRGLFA